MILPSRRCSVAADQPWYSRRIERLDINVRRNNLRLWLACGLIAILANIGVITICVHFFGTRSLWKAQFGPTTIELVDTHMTRRMISIHAAPQRRLRVNDQSFDGIRGEPPCYWQTAKHWVFVSERVADHQSTTALIVVNRVSGKVAVCRGPDVGSLGHYFGLPSASGQTVVQCVAESEDEMVIAYPVGARTCKITADLDRQSFALEYE